MRIRVSISFSRTISPDTAWETLITVARSRFSTGAPIVVVGPCTGSPFVAGYLGQRQCVLFAESRWIGFGPLAQLLPVRRQEFAPRLLLVGRRVLIACRHRQRGIIKVVEQLDLGGCGRKERLHLVG